TVSVKESVLIINGSADYVIGGGLAMAYGAVSSVKDVNIILNGNANYVHGGGYAFSGGTADVSGLAYIFQTAKSTVRNTLYAGGYASGSGSNAPVNSAHVISLGQTGKLMQNSGFAENGASAAIGTYSIELVNPKVVPTQQSYVPQPENNFYPMGGTTVMYVGPNQQARNFTDAINLLPNNAGNVEFRIMGNFRQESDVVIPSNRGITSVTVTGNNNTRMTVTWPEDIGFFANGIPTTIANSVAFRDGVIYGGANVGAGQQSVLRSTYLDISGSVNKVVAGSKAKGAASSASVGSSTLIFRGKASAWIYAGGAALYGGYSSVDNASLSLMQGASVEQSISGGGYSFGAGSQSDVKDSYMDVSGSVIYAVYMGGYADQSGSAATTGQVYLNLQAAGNVGQSVWYGGRAYKNAYVTVDTAMAQISGRVGAMVHKEGRASDGGSVHIRVIR
ncbi:MAG: hypothetical protein IKP86_01350, partial [Anaerolineaceae bacterium]|nr:hypothetical protein [Anaerolineaceae bacterium]